MRRFAEGFLVAYLIAAVYFGVLFQKASYGASTITCIRAGIVWPISAAMIFTMPPAGPPEGSHEPCGDEDVCAG